MISQPLRASWWVSGLFLLMGCKTEGNLGNFSFQRVTVTAGDFDDVGDPLNRQGIAYELADGIISTATWDPDLQHDALALDVEDLFGLSGELSANQAVLVASGTRGLGKRQYNGLEPDDQLVSDPTIVENVREYVEFGGVLVATDWAYDLVEAAWPGAASFVNDDAIYDDAQRGLVGSVSAHVANDALAESLGTDTVAITFDYSNWAVLDGVGDDTDVFLTADVQYRPDTTSDVVAAPGTPLMFGYTPRGAEGRVVFMSFHVDAQNAPMIDALLEATVGHFEPPPSVTVGTE